MTLRCIALLAATAAASGCASTNRRPSLPYLERFYVAAVPSDTSLMYEAQANAHVLLVDQLADAYDHISMNDSTTGSALAWRVIVSPMFGIRQLKDSSAAVRTPSFMPRASVEVLHVSRAGGVTTDGAVVKFPRVRMGGLRFSVAHHSNGQAGCFREGFVPVDRRSNACRPRPGYDTNVVTLNRANGDFSSTYLELLGHWTIMNRGEARIPTWSVGGAVAADAYPRWLFGQTTDEQRDLYGDRRARALVELMWHPLIGCGDEGSPFLACQLAGRMRLTGEYVRAQRLDTDLARRIQPAVIPYRWSIELSDALDRWLGAGLFVRWVDGQDYYNIGFAKRRRAMMFGFMLDTSGPDRITRKSALP